MFDIQSVAKKIASRNTLISLAVLSVVGLLFWIGISISQLDSGPKAQQSVASNTELIMVGNPVSKPDLVIVSQSTVQHRQGIEIQSLYLQDRNSKKCFLLIHTDQQSAGLAEVPCQNLTRQGSTPKSPD